MPFLLRGLLQRERSGRRSHTLHRSQDLDALPPHRSRRTWANLVRLARQPGLLACGSRRPRIIELDPSTLAPRSKAVAAPGLVADRVELACAASCRIVAQSIGGDIVSWAAGEHSPTRVASHWERGKWGDSPAWLLAATYQSGDLVVAYHGSWGKTIYADTSVRTEIRVARGDARGAGARVVGAIPVANNWPPQNVSAIPTGPVIYATFAPGGLIVVETFQFTRGYYSPVAGAVIPLGR